MRSLNGHCDHELLLETKDAAFRLELEGSLPLPLLKNKAYSLEVRLVSLAGEALPEE